MSGIAIQHVLLGNGRPWCIKCKRVVDSIEHEWPGDFAHFWNGSATYEYRGITNITIRCHGEEWKQTLPGLIGL
jgi:hypothetical protein